jgi:uncharacterized membrane protein
MEKFLKKFDNVSMDILVISVIVCVFCVGVLVGGIYLNWEADAQAKIAILNKFHWFIIVALITGGITMTTASVSLAIESKKSLKTICGCMLAHLAVFAGMGFWLVDKIC